MKEEETSALGQSGARINVCNCFQVTYEELQKMLDATNGASFEVLKKYYYVGSRCTACQYEIKDLITVYRDEQQAGLGGFGTVAVPVRQRLESSYRRLRDVVRRRFASRRFGLFVLKAPFGESSLVLSNLRFPEDAGNVNGSQVKFQLVLFDALGSIVGRKQGLQLKSDASCEYLLSDLFPDLPSTFYGMLFLDYGVLSEVGSLRPYCCFNFDRSETGYQGRWHYHDKYSLNDYNGHYHNNHPLFQGQECWMAVSNPRALPYAGIVSLRTSDGQCRTVTFELPAHGSWWGRIHDLFPDAPQSDPNALLWFDTNQRLMVWFFWHKLSQGVWIVQHH